MTNAKKVKLATLFAALGSEPRMTILDLFNPPADGVAAELSAKDLAGRLGWPLSNVSYHVKLLREAGLIKTVRETPRRGAVERHQGITPAGTVALQVLYSTEALVR